MEKKKRLIYEQSISKINYYSVISKYRQDQIEQEREVLHKNALITPKGKHYNIFNLDRAYELPCFNN